METRIGTPHPPLARPRQTLILDSNVVLDWLVFRNPESAAVATALLDGRVRWIATRPMREELEHVLARGHLDAWAPDGALVRAQWERHCEEHLVPAATGPGARLRCSDPDDQKFIDLAVAARADWLLTRDRAVLKLAARLRAHGVRVARPGEWQAADD